MYVQFTSCSYRVGTFCEAGNQNKYKLQGNERNLNIAITGGLFLYMVDVDPTWSWVKLLFQW